jgi:hypothetical protein
MIVYKNIPDQLVVSSTKAKIIRNNILSQKDKWILNQNNLTKRKLNKVGIDIHKNHNVSLYETPIFYGNVDKELVYWILSFELNDIIRIFIANNIEFDENCKIIHSKS